MIRETCGAACDHSPSHDTHLPHDNLPSPNERTSSRIQAPECKIEGRDDLRPVGSACERATVQLHNWRDVDVQKLGMKPYRPVATHRHQAVTPRCSSALA